MLISGLHRQQHVSGVFPLCSNRTDDLSSSCVRCYVRLSPGDHTVRSTTVCGEPVESSDTITSIPESRLDESSFENDADALDENDDTFTGMRILL